jgi:cytochrome c5
VFYIEIASNLKIMKKGVLGIGLLAGTLFLFQSFLTKNPAGEEFPAEVKEVLTTSCFDCHTAGARSEDAKKALNFDQWDEYRLTKKIGTLDKIAEVVGEGKMPPEKYLERKPESKLSKDQQKLIVDWTKKTSEALMGGGQ